MGRLLLAKTFVGDLAGTSTAQMLAVRTATEGSAGYVALENVTGTLAGRTGSFVLQHSGAMSLSCTVIPDSGTGDLVGLSGTMTIEQDASGHRYTFNYTLPE